MAIIAVDFDGTIVTHEYPEIGKEVPGAIETIKVLQKNGHDVFLWTMRDKLELQEAIAYLEDKGIYLNGYNRSPAQFSSSLKQYASIYIDDAALGCPLIYPDQGRPYVDWSGVMHNMLVYKLITLEQYNEIYKISFPGR